MRRSILDEINPRYLFSVDDDPNKVLEPIWGYAKVPLLSLTDACKPLHNIVSHLEPHILVALEDSRNPADGLTQDESASIRLYTMEWKPTASETHGSLYSHLNKTLKAADRSKLRPWFRYLKLFLTALAKIPVAHHHIVWRGVRKDHSADYEPGTTVTWWPFSSCTISLNVLQSDLYLGNSGTRTLFSIEALNARTIQNHSRFTAEDEILLLPGTHLQVVSKLNSAPDMHIIHLKQIRPTYELLEPPFHGALIYPRASEADSVTSVALLTDPQQKHRVWYKRKRILIGLGVAPFIIMIVIILGVVLGSRKGSTNGDVSTLSPAITRIFQCDKCNNSTINWSGYDWNVRNEINSQKDSSNWTSNNVCINGQSCIYFKLTRNTANKWWCAQATSENQFSFGSFVFYIESRIDLLDPNVVFSLSITNGFQQPNGIFIDMSARGKTEATAKNLWYTIYPNAANQSLNRAGAEIPTLTSAYSTHRIHWKSDSVEIRSEDGFNYDGSNNVFYQFITPSSWASAVPQAAAHLSINLCTFYTKPPTDGKEVQIIIHNFYYNSF